MPTCFVIQPFDAGKFDKRFDDVYVPAIEDVGLDAYRVDRDPGVDVPIEGRLTDAGWSWIEGNESLFVLKKQPPKQTDDEIPF